MILDNIDRWRRRLDLDQIEQQSGVINEQLSRVFEILDDGQSNKPIIDLIRCILLQSLIDRALAVHIFYDDEDNCLRMLYCLAVPPEHKRCPLTPSQLPEDGLLPECGDAPRLVHSDPTNADYERVWYEMVPPPAQIAERFFRRLRWYARIGRGDSEGALLVRYRGHEHAIPVCAVRPDDIRVYYSSERPPIRPKLTRHYREVGVPTPDANTSAVSKTL